MRRARCGAEQRAVRCTGRRGALALNQTRSSVMRVMRATGVWKMEAISLRQAGRQAGG